MVLNDYWIHNHSYIINPFDSNRVNPTSYDLTWSGRYKIPQCAGIVDLRDKEQLNNIWSETKFKDELIIKPNDFLLLDTLETLEMPVDVCGFLMLKSSIGRVGVEHHHAGFFDPGFGLGKPSTGTLEITNTAPWSIKIYKGQPIVQMVFMKCKEPLADYRFTGHFNGQKEPTGVYVE